MDERYCRDPRKCFSHGQKLRHKACGTDDIIYFTYDKENNYFIYEGNYLSMNRITTLHYKRIRPERQTQTYNAWAECEYEKSENVWISTYQIPL